MKTKILLHVSILSIFIGLGAVVTNAQTVYQWNGTTDSNWETVGNWQASPGKPTSGTTQNSRLNVYNKALSPLNYTAAQGTTVFATAGTNPRALVIASGAGNNGAMNILGGVWESRGAQDDLVANAATGILTVDGGVYTNSGTKKLVITFQGTSSTGTLTVNSGSAAVETIQLGDTSAAIGSGTVNLNGGTLWTKAITDVGSSTLYSLLTLNGGTIRVLGAGTLIASSVDGVSVKAGGAKFDTAGFDTTVAKGLTNGIVGTDGGLTKLGLGSLTLAGANTYTGPTTTSNGVLNTTTISTGGGAYTNIDGTTLGVTVNAAGQSLNMSKFTIGANCTNTLALGSGNPTAPVINITGDLNLNGDVRVNVSGSGQTLGTYVLLQYAGTRNGSGSFVPGTLPVLGGGYGTAVVDDVVNKQVKLVVALQQNLKWAAANGDWDLTTANWVPLAGGGATTYGSVDSVTFNDEASGSTPVTINLTADRSPNSLTVSNATKDYIFTGSRITGAIALNKDGAATLTLSNNNSYGLTVINAGTLQVGAGGGAGTLGSGAVTDNGALVFNRSDALAVPNSISGTGAVTQAGSGTTTVSGANTYSGSTIVNAGKLQLGAANVIPDGSGKGGVTIAAGTFDLHGFSETINGLTGNGTIDNSGAAATLTVGNNNAGGAFGGTIQNTGSALALTKVGSGTLVLSGTNSYTGLTTVAADNGTLLLSNLFGISVGGDVLLGNGTGGGNAFLQLAAFEQIANAAVVTFNAPSGQNSRMKLMGFTETVGGISDSTTRGIIENTELETSYGSTVGWLTVNNSSDYSFNGFIRDARAGGSGKVGFTKDGTGALTLSGANITYTQPTLVKNGTLILTNATAFASSPTITGGQLQLSIGTTVQNVNITNLANNGLGFLNTNAFTIGGLAGTGDFGLTNTAGSPVTLTVGNNNTSTLYSGGMSGAGGLNKIGSATLTLAGTNTYTGPTTISNGYVNIQNARALDGTSGITVSAAALRLEGSFTAATKPITIAGAGPGDSMGSLRPHAGDSVWPGPVTLASDLARVGAISNTSLTISGVIDSGANNYGLGIRSANDGGIITLSASNTYKGQTHLVVGNLRLAGGDNRLPITGALTNGNSSEQGYATFDLNGFNQQLAGLASLGATMPLSVTNSSSTLSTLTLSNDATLYSSRGPIGGKIALVEAGTSSHFQVLSGANTYSGDTTISSGNLKLGASNVIPDGVGKGNVILNGSLDLAGFSDTINGLSGSGIVGNSAGTAPVLTVGNNDATSTFNGIMRNFAGALSLVKTGAGTLTLGGSNAYNGATTISTGTLAFGPGGSMNSSSGLTIVPGARLDISAADSFALGASQALTAGRTTGFTTDIQGRLTNNGSILVAGTSQAGTLTINGGLALTGGSLSYDLTGVTTPGSGVNDLIAINGALDLSGMTIINATFLGGSPTVGAYTLITGGTSLSGTAAGNLSLNWPSSSTRLTASLDTTTTVGSVFLQVSGSGSNLVWLGTNGSAWDLNLTTNWDNAGTADRFLNFDSALFNDSSTNGAVDITATIIPAAVVVSNGTLPYTFSTSGAGKISGGASLTKQGTNTLALNLANDYSGPTVITGGILQLGSALALGNTSGSTYATNGGTLDLNSKLLGNEAVTIQGAGADGQGALINSPPSFTANYGLRFLTLAGDATVGGQGRFDVANAPTVLGNGFTLTKVGTNTVNFVDAGNTGFGDINVNAGMFQLQGNSTAGQPANTLTVASGATLGFYVSTVTISKALALNGGSIWVRNSTAALNGPMTLADTNSFQVDGTSLTLFGPIGGTGGFAKAGSGVLNLNNTNSNWAGDSWLSGGAVNVGASSALVGNVSNAVALSFLPGAGATFNCPANIVGSGSLTQPATAPGTTVLSGSNVIDGGITVSAGTLQVANTGSLTGNATVNAATLLVTGGQLNAGTLSVGQNVVNSTNLVTGGGSVSVGHGSTNDLLVGVRSINTGINPRGTLDASGAASLMANVGNLLVGVSTEASTVNPSGGFLFLATNNTITATNIAFGHVLGGGGFNDALTNVVRLGSGSNVFQTPVMIVGGNKMSANFSLPTGGIFVLNDGAAPTDLSVGSTRLLTSGSPGVSADLSGGTFQASLGNLIIGHKDKGPDGSSGSGITRASLTLGSSANNNVTASSVMLGELLDGVGGKSYGTLTVGGGQFFVSNNVTLSSLTGTGTASGTLNLTGGTFSVGGDIVDAGGTSTLLLDGATLDLQPAGRTTNGLIGSVTSPINSFAFRTGTLKNVGEINGGVPFIKDTPGTLILDGVNTFTGPVAVSNGTLFVNGSIGAVPVSVAGGTFGGSGIVDGSVTIHTNGTLAIGPVIEDLLINSDLSLAGTVVMKIDRDHSIGADRITVAYPYILSYGGRLVVTNLGSDLHEGDGFTLFEAFGMLAGAFTEFVLPSLPSGLGWDLSHLSAYGTIYVKVLPGITALTPAEQTLECGVNATFTVTATGPDLAYQWFFGPTPIPWGTGAELIITNVSAANAGTYTVQVSNAAGSTNASGMLLVSDSSPPNITCPADIIVTNTAGGGEIVTFTASAFDNCGPPSVVCAPPSGSSFAVGTTQVQCIATDSATNMGSCLFMVEVRTLLVVTGHVALEAFVGPAHDGNGTRDVVFTATDNATNVLAIWTNTLTFAPGADGYGEAPFALANVPVGTTHLSAKTAWNLRTRLPVTFAGNVATAEFTGADELLGGDIHGANNLVDVDDYFQLAASWYGVDPASDIDGSGLVDVDDYFLLTSHWYTEGDAP